MIDLSKGILLEDSGFLLEWGQPVEKLAAQSNSLVESNKNEFIVYWNNTILNGLKINLYSSFSTGTLFHKIEYWVLEDNESLKKFDEISMHLYKALGNPYSAEDTHSDKSRIWQINEVTISIYLFEQHVYKLCFSIENLSLQKEQYLHPSVRKVTNWFKKLLK